MESNKTYHLVFKYAFLVAGLLIMTVPGMSFIFPDSVVINGETGPLDSVTTIVMGLIGLILILVFVVIKDKFVMVELRAQTLIIKHNGQERTVNWLDVESVSQIQFIFPPLYKLKVKENLDSFWFNTQSRYVSVGGHISDMSDMGDLIKKKKRELGV